MTFKISNIGSTFLLLTKEVRKIHKNITKDIVEEAKRIAPVDTGLYKRSIKSRGNKKVIADVKYARYLEKPYVRSNQAPDGVLPVAARTIINKYKRKLLNFRKLI